ncbi:MAG TPA: hypothetical protein VNY05_30015 [Candidatus Acidoferrales bacterium]|jgi:xylan 1,4-beta-xylosidase|nr:hypothetical protein [Candidatus Acidoferrales bacterium]
MTRLALILAAVAVSYAADTRRSWASDNRNGTYSNPLFYDEFSDPDMIRAFKTMGGELQMPFQLKTFQGVRYPLFHYNAGGSPGGQADFDNFLVDEPRPRGLTKPIPIGQRIGFEDLADGNVLVLVDGRLHSVASAPTAFKVVDRGRGRIALQTTSGHYLSVSGAGIGVTSAQPGDSETFQCVDLQRGDALLLSLAKHRYVVIPKTPGPVSADHPGPAPDRKDGSCSQWKVAK